MIQRRTFIFNAVTAFGSSFLVPEISQNQSIEPDSPFLVPAFSQIRSYEPAPPTQLQSPASIRKLIVSYRDGSLETKQKILSELYDGRATLAHASFNPPGGQLHREKFGDVFVYGRAAELWAYREDYQLGEPILELKRGYFNYPESAIPIPQGYVGIVQFRLHDAATAKQLIGGIAAYAKAHPQTRLVGMHAIEKALLSMPYAQH